MTHLLDTGVLIRAALRTETLPLAIKTILDRPGAVFALSAYSLWEVGKKVQKGKLVLPHDLGAWFDAVLTNVVLLPLEQRVVVEAMQLPEFPNQDPGDELIVATARVHKLTLLTTDTKLKGYRHARIQYFKPLPETG
jgi:PIN domain nuclease of toxin-antitoxin system